MLAGKGSLVVCYSLARYACATPRDVLRKKNAEDETSDDKTPASVGVGVEVVESAPSKSPASEVRARRGQPRKRKIPRSAKIERRRSAGTPKGPAPCRQHRSVRRRRAEPG
jgi:hypothetical protein